MSFFDDRGGRGDRGDLGPPPEPFRLGGGEAKSPVPLRWIGIAAGLLLLYIVLNTFKSLYVDLLWFESVAFSDVYRTALTWRLVLFIIGAVAAAVIIGANIVVARRFAPRGLEESFIEEVEVDAIRRIVTILLIAATLFMSVIFGTVMGSGWETVLAWRNQVSFGLEDPQFGRDISFYIFSLPAYQLIQSWLLGVVVVSAAAAGAVYALALSLQRFEWRITPPMRIHLSILGGTALLLIAANTYLGIFGLVSTGGGAVFGATYTDVNARLPVQYLLTGLAAATGVVAIANAFLSRDSFRLPLFMAGLWIFAGFVGGVIYPNFVQSFQVDPNELQRERPFIARNIEATRYAFGLNTIDERGYPANPEVTQEEFDANPETMANVRILDPIPLRDTFNQIQAIRQFYNFWDIDVSRYIIDGEIQQVMIAARELDISRAQDRNWTRERLQLTHGFGAVVSPVNEVGQEGLPNLITRDIPPVSTELPITEEGARIYYGELTQHYVIGNSREPEFDYPVGSGNAEVFYPYESGIQLNSMFRRLALAWELGDQNILISSQIHGDSRLLMHRQIQTRVNRVAPFLRLDSDPFVFISEGRLMWMQPAYTVASSFPYAQPTNGLNYIRHSVTITIDAQTGDMKFYLIDPSDPIISTWANIFPDLFTPVDEMPAAVLQQSRYPLDMFKVQSLQYLRYHITNPDVFFIGEDVWNIPTERIGNEEQPVEPYYVVMKLPQGDGTEAIEDQVEFVLIMPFTPRNRQNTVAWLAGRADGENFGSMRAYRFPTETVVFGPAQVEARIDQHPIISQQLSLWSQSGSSVLRGNLIMIPIGTSFLYVEPIYLQADSSRLPELVRIVVANGNRIAMEPTFQRSLDVLAGRRAPTQPGELDDGRVTPTTPDPIPGVTPGTPSVPTIPAGTLADLLEQAGASADATQAELDRLRAILEAIEAQLATQSPQP